MPMCMCLCTHGHTCGCPLNGDKRAEALSCRKAGGNGGGREQQRPGALISLVPDSSKPLGTGVKPCQDHLRRGVALQLWDKDEVPFGHRG